MPRLQPCAPLLGLFVGSCPAAMLVLLDHSAGHASDTIDLILLILIGIPGMAVGVMAGAAWRHGIKSTRYVALPVSALIGGLLGLAAGVLLHETFRVAFSIREHEAGLIGLIVGGLVAVIGLELLTRRGT